MNRVAERLQAFLQEIGKRARVLLREIAPRNALTGAIALLAFSFLVLSLAVVWLGVTWSRQAAEQATRQKRIMVRIRRGFRHE
jgi:preprotein translocase subunit SecG